MESVIENCLARFVIIRYDKSRKVVTRGLKSLPAEAGGFNQKGDYQSIYKTLGVELKVISRPQFANLEKGKNGC